MIFHWDDENRAHIARHDVTESQAEGAFLVEDTRIFPVAGRLNRWVLEATWKAGHSRSPSPGFFPRDSGSSPRTG
jgi:hypothetical protein